MTARNERTCRYKQEHGFALCSPRLAAIVQCQVDSEISGVGFSLNPLTNDYDESRATGTRRACPHSDDHDCERDYRDGESALLVKVMS